jgi:hypothetical protein
MKRSCLTPELTGRAPNVGTDKLTMKAPLFALRLNELLGAHHEAVVTTWLSIVEVKIDDAFIGK